MASLVHWLKQVALPMKREDGEPEEKAVSFSSIYAKLHTTLSKEDDDNVIIVI
jgi:hypothetical protein